MAKQLTGMAARKANDAEARAHERAKNRKAFGATFEIVFLATNETIARQVVDEVSLRIRESEYPVQCVDAYLLEDHDAKRLAARARR